MALSKLRRCHDPRVLNLREVGLARASDMRAGARYCARIRDLRGTERGGRRGGGEGVCLEAEPLGQI